MQHMFSEEKRFKHTYLLKKLKELKLSQNTGLSKWFTTLMVTGNTYSVE